MKKQTLILSCVVFALLLFPPLRLSAQNGASSGTQIAERTQVETRVTGGIATLYALDPLARTLCFADGKAGGVFYNNEVRNHCSNIEFDSYKAGSFSVGVEGGQVGTIIDLGNTIDLKHRYGYEETVGGGQGFASLHLEDGGVVILKDRKLHTMQKLRESALLFEEGTSGANAPVKLGGIYLIRLTDQFDKAFQHLVKVLVIAYTPNESVTIRWQVL